MADSVEKINLQFGLYPYIPDLGNDNLQGLKVFIKNKFENENPDITLTVSSEWDPYDLDKVVSRFKKDNDPFDILEVDTLLLGEIVEKGVVQEVHFSKQKLQGVFLEPSVEAVTYKGICYGIPTLNCANFLFELVAGYGDGIRVLSTLETGHQSFNNLREVVEYHKDIFKEVSPLVGNFRGKWTLPMMYLDAYVDVHGRMSLVDGASIAYASIAKETKVLDNMMWLMNLDDNTHRYRYNKGKRGEYKSGAARHADICKSDHIMMYGYSEWLSEVLADKMCNMKKIHASCIIAPPLGADNNLLTYTDAIIVNKALFEDKKRAKAINTFITFYTSLDFRNKFAEGADLTKPHPPRYVMVSRKDFYTKGFGTSDKNYKMLHSALQFSIAAPNHGLYDKVTGMNKVLVEKLGLSPIS